MVRGVGRRTFIGGAVGTGLATFAAPAIAGVPSRTNLRAFVMGVNAYRLLKPLERAVADATSVAKALSGHGYHVTLAQDTDRKASLDLFNQFKADLQPGDAAFLFLAGHGLQLAGEGYVLPSDADCRSMEAFETTAISLSSLMAQLSYRNPAQAIAVVDACRNPLKSVDLPRRIAGMASVSAPEGFCLLFSAGSGEFALDTVTEDDADPNGLFTRYFVPNLTRSAGIDDIFYSTSTAVTQTAMSVDHPQHPAFYNQSGRRLHLVPENVPKSPQAAGFRAAGGVGGGGGVGARLDKCGVLLVKCANYDGMPRLMAPAADTAALRAHFSRFGATVQLVDEPDTKQLRQACEDFAAAGFERIIFYYSGMGGLAGNDGVLIVNDQDGGDARLLQDVGNGAAMVSLAELHRYLSPMPQSAGADAVPVYIFIDSCLSDLGIEITEASGYSLIEELRRGKLSNVSVLYSGAYGQPAFDVVADGRGALSLALTETFRPGATLGDIASETRRIVARLTRQAALEFGYDEDGQPQTPQLFASWDMEDSIPLPLAP